MATHKLHPNRLRKRLQVSKFYFIRVNNDQYRVKRHPPGTVIVLGGKIISFIDQALHNTKQMVPLTEWTDLCAGQQAVTKEHDDGLQKY